MTHNTLLFALIAGPIVLGVGLRLLLGQRRIFGAYQRIAVASLVVAGWGGIVALAALHH